jgi:hypothetical protein
MKPSKYAALDVGSKRHGRLASVDVTRSRLRESVTAEPHRPTAMRVFGGELAQA